MPALRSERRSESRLRVVVLTSDVTEPPANATWIEERADVVYVDAAGLPDALPGAEILFVWDFFSTALRDAWSRADALRWVHVAAAGVDSLLFDGLRQSEVVVTNAQGAFDEPIAEFVLACVLAQDKRLHESRELQRQHAWRHREPLRTAGGRALVVGTGGIGRATARLLRAVGLQVRGAGRIARTDDPDFGTVVPSADLAEHVDWADHVVLIAPLTEQTRGMVGAEVLALREGQIAAASLDVFSQEPLPEDHPFWDLPTAHVSAHLSGDVVGWRETLAEQFAANLTRWLAGEELANRVDKDLGYARRG